MKSITFLLPLSLRIAQTQLRFSKRGNENTKIVISSSLCVDICISVCDAGFQIQTFLNFYPPHDDNDTKQLQTDCGDAVNSPLSFITSKAGKYKSKATSTGYSMVYVSVWWNLVMWEWKEEEKNHLRWVLVREQGGVQQLLRGIHTESNLMEVWITI